MNKKWYILPLLVASIMALQPVAASPVTPRRAATVAQHFWRTSFSAKQADTLVDASAHWPFSGIYLFTNPAGGYVLVAADDAVRPILGYSPTGRIDPANMPQPLTEWLEGYQRQIDFVRANNVQPYAADAAEWQRLEQGLAAKQPAEAVVGPLLSTNWDQIEPYNELCPNSAATGCAATAQAQMMKFWNHPPFGVGSHRYVSNIYGEQSADFAHTLYDWQNMPSQPTISSPQAERTAVATLIYHCGVSVDMDYHPAGSGGSSAVGLVGVEGYASIDNSLQNYFRYSPSMYVITKDGNFTNDTWRQALIDELNQGHPIVYTGSAQQGGHGFVCDGYDTRQYLHFNFGWSGVGDGYFPVDSISPGVGGTGGNVTYTFNLYNQALMGAVPVREPIVSDTLITFPRNGGDDSLLFAPNDTASQSWSVSCSQPWVEVRHNNFAHAGWVKLVAQPNTTQGERIAEVIFTQGPQQVKVKVVQSDFNDDELCPVTVVMESTNGQGWGGDARLTLQSASGFQFGSVRLDHGRRDSVQVLVAPHNVYSVWHPGGGTDRYINYYVKNQYHEPLVSVTYAYRDGGTHLIEWPCAHLGIGQSAEPDITLYPNPATDILNISAPGVQLVQLTDVCGRVVATSQQTSINISALPAGIYFVKLTTHTGLIVRKIEKY